MIQEINEYTNLNRNVKFQSPNWSIGLTSNSDFALPSRQFKKWRCWSNREARSIYNHFIENENFDGDTNPSYEPGACYVYVFGH